MSMIQIIYKKKKNYESGAYHVNLCKRCSISFKDVIHTFFKSEVPFCYIGFGRSIKYAQLQKKEYIRFVTKNVSTLQLSGNNNSQCFLYSKKCDMVKPEPLVPPMNLRKHTIHPLQNSLPFPHHSLTGNPPCNTLYLPIGTIYGCNHRL